MKFKYIIIIVAIILSLSGCNKLMKNKQMEQIVRENGPNIIIATDLHYLSYELTDNSEDFQEFIKTGDGKVIHYTPDITDAFITEVIKAHPVAFIISGDLTFNGEKKSHEELSKKLKAVKEAGIHVLVIPGNHDIFSPRSYQFIKDKVYTTSNITPDDFRTLYGDMGYKEAIDLDPNSLSYLYEVTEDVWVIMIDANKDMGYAIDSGRISKETLNWIGNCLEKGKNEEVTVITVTHQNLLPHNELFTSAFTILNGKELTKLLEEYQVKLNLSGHMHIQDIKQSENDNGIYDIATSSLATYPNQYGIVHISPDQELTYQSKRVDVNQYALNKKSKDENLLNYDVYSRQFFYESSYQKIYNSLADANLTESECKKMAEFAADVNVKYFSGTLYKTQQEDLEKEAYSLWNKKANDIFFSKYLQSILKQESMDNNKIIIP